MNTPSSPQSNEHIHHVCGPFYTPTTPYISDIPPVSQKITCKGNNKFIPHQYPLQKADNETQT